MPGIYGGPCSNVLYVKGTLPPISSFQDERSMHSGKIFYSGTDDLFKKRGDKDRATDTKKYNAGGIMGIYFASAGGNRVSYQ